MLGSTRNENPGAPASLVPGLAFTKLSAKSDFAAARPRSEAGSRSLQFPNVPSLLKESPPSADTANRGHPFGGIHSTPTTPSRLTATPANGDRSILSSGGG